MDPGAFRPEAFQQAPARARAPEREVGVRREPELHVSPARAANESERPAIGPERAAAMGDASSAKPAADPSAGARDPSAAPAARPKSLQLVPPRRPAWPPRERPTASRWKPLALGAALVVVLGGAWLVAGRSKPGAHRGFALPAFGPRFTVTVNSQPAGASIAADGKPSGLITPATLELPAGDHELTLSLAGKGSATYKVSGERDERTSLEALMYGGLKITAADANLPVSVTLDGLDRGYAPLSVEDLLPGPHEIRFRAPGVDPWTETFELKVGETHEVVARPFTMPETGMIDVHATVAGGDGVVPLKGAAIFVDGEPRGVTPASIELPRGPHSIRVAYRGEEAPVQVIDLPGGNHRIADFAFGTDFQPPSFVQIAPEGPVARARPTVVSAAITDMGEADLREMWLHVRDPEGAWRRYEMTLLRAPDGIVGVALFPVALLGPDGAATYYVSALTQEGDEYYTELRTPHARGSRAPRSKGHAPPPPATVPSTP